MNTRTLTTFASTFLLCTALWLPTAFAYESYDNGLGVGCVECHPLFSGGPTRILHAFHTSNFGITECNLCHTNGGGSLPVLTYGSGPGGGLGCAGCHGRDYGELSSTDGLPKASAYGLRQVHADEGETVCVDCHVAGANGHPNPLPAILPENVDPPYFDQPGTNLRNSCDSFQEDSFFDVDLLGLDNDGDGARDYPADADCPTTTTTTSTTTTTTTSTTLALICEAAPTLGCEPAGAGKLQADAKSAGKEKLKVQFKKIETATVQGDFGDPAVGTTNYALCIYDELDALSSELLLKHATNDCAGKPCWSAVSTKGYKYKDKAGSADGVTKALLKSGSAGRGSISIMGKNNAAKGLSSLPTDIASSLSGATTATVQLLSSNAACFEVTTDDVKQADGISFKAGVAK